LIAVEMARRTKTDAADLTLSIDGRGKHDILLDDQRTNVKAMSWNGSLPSKERQQTQEQVDRRLSCDDQPLRNRLPHHAKQFALPFRLLARYGSHAQNQKRPLSAELARCSVGRYINKREELEHMGGESRKTSLRFRRSEVWWMVLMIFQA
jgi:hypothetical protein